ncbi:MAG: ABC transporter ATP-binding protein [Armatimonadota bacterium]|nr:ABC transporter ATP-binding protein [Armatimonadota bacterium]MDR7427566.1 ABC transporter ATP-binding protein [Armatimonadota bacterium]MDR7465011.1 ABC transporter ATP-binding protein [Armatimonadota bacterium]MDR7469777.1 ABC transporter ATP-binding protein [Armatimonadota bacterium]MDR7474676.1 ABC transporter ATP-binding protein [Armatimonadota bacterium]
MTVPLLEIRRITKAFDGLVALQDVSLAVWPGQIKGLIGPNGAGKTTLFNLITGLIPPLGGDILFRGRSIVGLPPYRIADLGIARTFQNVQLFVGMTVLENVLVGFHRHMRGGLLDAAFRSRRMRHEEREVRDRALLLLEEFDLLRWAHEPVESLPFGLQRVVEVARAVAAAPSLVLLDEPGAGLGGAEKVRLTQAIRNFCRDGVTVFLVEHDMELMMGLADEVAVLDQTVLIAEGPPAVIQNHPAVIAAYLGEAEPTDAP